MAISTMTKNKKIASNVLHLSSLFFSLFLSHTITISIP